DKEAEKKWEKVNVEGQELLDSRTGKPRRAVSGRRSGMDRRAFGRSIPGIDLERGLERFNGDHKSFIKVLRSYAVNTRALLEKNKDVREENLHEYAIAVHGIKSSSRSICADFIGAEAEALEKAANAGNFPFVAAGNPEFIEAVNELIDSLENALDRMEEENSKPVKDRPDAELLGRLIDACQAYDIDAIDKIMDEIESFEYEADGGLAAWLRENVDLMNLTQIVDRLSEETA
ncbi:MAG: histidine kinase, partial [Treponema sp.]|nr:histidine kinase [Treponema sp.]